MAVIDKNGRWHGPAGNLVFRQVGTQQVAQIKPGNVKQTAATRESALEFGLASNTARNIRQHMAEAYHTPDKGMANRLTRWILKGIGRSEKPRGERDIHDGDVGVLKGFQFNAKSPLSDVFNIKPEVKLDEDGKIQVRIGAFNAWKDIKCPFLYFGGFTLRILVVAFHFRSEYVEYLGYQDKWIGRKSEMPEQIWTLDKEFPEGSIILVTVSLTAGSRSEMGTETYNTADWSPSEIIEAFKVPQGDMPVLEPVTRDLRPEEAEGRHLVQWSDSLFGKLKMDYSGQQYHLGIQHLRKVMQPDKLQELAEEKKERKKPGGIDEAKCQDLHLPEGKIRL